MSHWKLKIENWKFALALHTALFVLVVTGVVPRSIVPFWTLALMAWAAVVPPKVSVPFFVAAVPLFIAIPVTPTFDSLTMWRPLSVVIFLRWFLSSFGRSDITAAAQWLARNARYLHRQHPLAVSTTILGVLAVVSLAVAGNLEASVRRIILFTNAGLIPVVLFAVAREDPQTARSTVGAIAYSAVIVIVAAFVQLASTYLIDIYQFMRIWGEGIQLRQFGTLWSDIAVWLGNTWFAYYGPQLSLRVFSLFPDSHSFPIYLIFAVAGLMAFSVRTLMERSGAGASFRRLAGTRTGLGIVWVPLALLAVILSGTRGIWAAAAGLPLVFLVIRYLLRTVRERRALWAWLSSFIVAFVLLFAVAYPIFTSPQFLLSKGDLSLFRERLRSIIDFGETSNSQRLEIWGLTLDSIARRPLLGVGIGNFPVVLDQRVFLARAGSTAHNIYLHIAAEMGVAALAAWLWFWLSWYRAVYRSFRDGSDPFWLGYDGWLLLAIPWVAAYLLTDAALFDERALLIFGVCAALTAARRNSRHV